MNHLIDEVSLHNKLEYITMMEFRACPGEIMNAAELGKTFIITRAKKPMAVLSQLPGDLVTVIDKKGKKSYELPK